MGINIKELRRQAGLSQGELGNRAGVSKQAISNWELGKAIPSGDNLLKLAEALKVEPRVLLAPENARDSLNDQERILMEKFRALNERERRLALALLTAISTIK